MKRWMALLLTVAIVFGCTNVAFAKAKQMEDGVPVWDEDTVRQYIFDYIQGESMDRLWGYYDLQIRRYIPIETYRVMLLEIEWLTGDFIGFGSYRSFEEPEQQLKTHVLHLCMEKQDLDVYFTHKNKEDDWEVMALEFVPAEKETTYDEVNESGSVKLYDSYEEKTLTISADSKYPLNAVITLPESASAANPAIGCVFIHDDGAYDMDMSIGQTTLFKDMAAEFAKYGIASIRYDKRTYAYPDYQVTTVQDEVIDDVFAAIKALSAETNVDENRILLVGVGFGGDLCPRISMNADGTVAGMVMIGASTKSKINQYNTRYAYQMTNDEKKDMRDLISRMPKMKADEAATTIAFGYTVAYYQDLDQYNILKTMRKMKLPTYVVQGREDAVTDENDGRRDFLEELGISNGFAKFLSYRGLNHLLMNDTSVDENGMPQYTVETYLDRFAARDICLWIKGKMPIKEK